VIFELFMISLRDELIVKLLIHSEALAFKVQHVHCRAANVTSVNDHLKDKLYIKYENVINLVLHYARLSYSCRMYFPESFLLHH
jgi:hypothetical protein